jgi:uncharacterized protein
LRLIRRVAVWGFILGLGGSLVGYAGKLAAPPDHVAWSWVVYPAGRAVATPALTLFYAAGVVLLLRSRAWHRLFRAFVPVGRMSLSNYLLQSVICTPIFYGYGLGLYGDVGPFLGIVMGIAIFFVLQVPFSAVWMHRFRFGPIEWLWRTLTYGQLQPLRANRAAPGP